MNVLTRLIGVVTAGGVMLAAAGHAAAQSPVMRGDVSGTIAWQAVNTGPPRPASGERWGNSLFGGAGAGWYWTDHLKTTVEAGAGTEATAYRGEQSIVEGRPTFRTTETTYTRRSLALGQHYQYFRNVWFHPYVGGGLDLTWERRTERTSPIVIYDDLSRTGRIVEPARVDGPRTELLVRPFAAVGFKAYMTRRTFFRSDLRVAFRSGIDQTLVGAGFGVDF